MGSDDDELFLRARRDHFWWQSYESNLVLKILFINDYRLIEITVQSNL